MQTFDENDISHLINTVSRLDPDLFHDDYGKSLVYKCRMATKDNGDGTSNVTYRLALNNGS